MSNDTADENHCGSVPAVDYHNYPYASHHVQSLEGCTAETHSPIDNFSNVSSRQDGMILGYGTLLAKESKQKHKADMEEQLKVIDIDQKFQMKSGKKRDKKSKPKST